MRKIVALTACLLLLLVSTDLNAAEENPAEYRAAMLLAEQCGCVVKTETETIIR